MITYWFITLLASVLRSSGRWRHQGDQHYPCGQGGLREGWCFSVRTAQSFGTGILWQGNALCLTWLFFSLFTPFSFALSDSQSLIWCNRVLLCSLQVFLVRKVTPPDANQLYAMKVLKKATLKGTVLCYVSGELCPTASFTIKHLLVPAHQLWGFLLFFVLDLCTLKYFCQTKSDMELALSSCNTTLLWLLWWFLFWSGSTLSVIQEGVYFSCKSQKTTEEVCSHNKTTTAGVGVFFFLLFVHRWCNYLSVQMYRLYLYGEILFLWSI